MEQKSRCFEAVALRHFCFHFPKHLGHWWPRAQQRRRCVGGSPRQNTWDAIRVISARKIAI
ncbi:hypothetical protein E2C01_017479 [Portunus trituberculatus]|uniref:Uncharacterized protein n=1 Tax=Portunus trituberculatus TaxID=210409 RepID=A0A5B7DTK3_PORTR|nr:hypothetical protein [Portunus trituberculatus]